MNITKKINNADVNRLYEKTERSKELPALHQEGVIMYMCTTTDGTQSIYEKMKIEEEIHKLQDEFVKESGLSV